MKKRFRIAVSFAIILALFSRSPLLSVSASDDDFISLLIESIFMSGYNGRSEPENTDFYAIQTYSDTVELHWSTVEGADSYKVYMYSNSKEKYCNYKYTTLYSSGACLENLRSDRTYKLLLQALDANGNCIKQRTTSITTLPQAPTLTVKKTSSKITVSWEANQNNASGYEVYLLKTDYDSVTKLLGYYSMSDEYFYTYTPERLKELGFKLGITSSEKAEETLKISNNDYCVLVRTYAVEDDNVIYSAFSDMSHTSSLEAYINGMQLNPKMVSIGEEAELVKKYAGDIASGNMSNYEKLYNIFKLVSSHGVYQYDITQIDGNRPVWQIMEKQEGQCASWAYCLDAMLEYVGFDIKVARGLRNESQQHFWCQLEINEKPYCLDANLGSFLVLYDGSYRGYEIVDLY